ncbi:MAG: DUF4105 domain-containing protein, partial [Muribaculaceae bacterium]|nr:DUF4105 domain-containing protein [Muribaculaceae bacterium]
MLEDEYIQASFIVVSPGDAIYSAGGHLALRMSCPIQNVDYIYEFDASLQPNENLIFSFLNGTLKGEYVRLYSDDFFAKIQNENRKSDEFSLNLTPSQEVTLWTNLDNIVDTNFVYPFSPVRYNCCSMLLTAIESSVQRGLFSSSEVSAVLNGSGRDYLYDFFSNSPWTGLLWNILLGFDFDKSQKTEFLYYPKVISTNVQLIKNPVNKESLIDTRANTTVFNEDKNIIFTPTIVFTLLFI